MFTTCSSMHMNAINNHILPPSPSLGEGEDSPCVSPGPQARIKPQFRQRKQRKTGLTTVELQKVIPELRDMNLGSDRKSPTSRCVMLKYLKKNI